MGDEEGTGPRVLSPTEAYIRMQRLAIEHGKKLRRERGQPEPEDLA